MKREEERDELTFEELEQVVGGRRHVKVLWDEDDGSAERDWRVRKLRRFRGEVDEV